MGQKSINIGLRHDYPIPKQKRFQLSLKVSVTNDDTSIN